MGKRGEEELDLGQREGGLLRTTGQQDQQPGSET
jgi:hypothetical protein